MTGRQVATGAAAPLTSRSSFAEGSRPRRCRESPWLFPRRRSRSRRRAAAAPATWKLARPGAQRVPALRRRQAAAHGVPQLRLVQGPRRRRSRLSRPPHMLPIALDAMGGDRAPGDILAGAHAAAALGIPVVLVGPEGLEGIGDLPLIVASEVIEMDDDAGRGRAPQEGLHARARRRGRARRQGQRHGLGRQHRRHDGVGAAAHGPHPWRQPPGHRHAHPRARPPPEHPARRRRQRRGAGRVAGAVRPDGLHLRPHTASASSRRRSACCPSARSPARATRSARRPSSCCPPRRASTSSATSRAAT